MLFNRILFSVFFSVRLSWLIRTTIDHYECHNGSGDTHTYIHTHTHTHTLRTKGSQFPAAPQQFLNFLITFLVLAYASARTRGPSNCALSAKVTSARINTKSLIKPLSLQPLALARGNASLNRTKAVPSPTLLSQRGSLE